MVLDVKEKYGCYIQNMWLSHKHFIAISKKLMWPWNNEYISDHTCGRKDIIVKCTVFVISRIQRFPEIQVLEFSEISDFLISGFPEIQKSWIYYTDCNTLTDILLNQEILWLSSYNCYVLCTVKNTTTGSINSHMSFLNIYISNYQFQQ